ncbi:ABC transporter permease [Longispora albida]|uniref:ABC transporter permease n=1 Tax=Longispora albida TaxID=203523 RepID=UPI000375CB9E|nr:ABC-2 family transporter protein [Longispora albida]
MFGFLRCSVLLTVAAAGAGGTLVGYNPAQLATYVWVSQGLIGVINFWTQLDLVERIKSGNIAADLLRPMDIMWMQLATELGRSLFGLVLRFTLPITVGAIFFDLYLPGKPHVYLLFVVAMVLSVLVGFLCRYILCLLCFWFLDIRGFWTAWVLCSGLLGGLQFPLPVWPDWLVTTLWVATPFPLLLQGPLDVLVERESGAVIGLQVVWLVILFGVSRLMQGRALRKLVVQGG